MKEALPSTGLNGVVHHWKDDLSAAISVSLVALPLGLGIALASNVPAMSGVLAAIIGGVVTTFLRGSHVAINGPTASLIVVVLSGVQTLADENNSGFKYVLAAIVVAGLIQVLLGLLKMGKLGDLFPASVISGMLATIGLTIFVKQFHVAFGVMENSGSVLDTIVKMPNVLSELNLPITIISVISLIILIFHPQVQNKFIKSIPAPLLVLIISIPMVFTFNFLSDSQRNLIGGIFHIDRNFLITVPDNILDNIIYPDFSKIDQPQFWIVVISITLVASIETLISTKAVDKLDHYKRRTDLNRDLFAVGLSTAVSGFLGGLPVITVIVRSSVNVNHYAKTKWSNFYHGILLLLFVFLFPMVIQEIPLASLATILIYTGYKLASPRVFRVILMKGWEQLFIMVSTLVASLAIDLLWGIIIGIMVTLLVQWMRSGLHIKTFVKHIFNTEIIVTEESKNVVHLDIKGIANFAILLKLINSLKELSHDKHCIVNFSRTKLVDSSVLEFIQEHREKYFINTDFEFTGLDVHKTSSPHPLALHILEKPMQRRLTIRQNDIFHFAYENHFKFFAEVSWDISHFSKFDFFEFHFVEYHRNKMTGEFSDGIEWVISDLTYTDGIMMAREEHQITVMGIFLPEELKSFVITKENIRQIKAQFKKSNQIALVSNQKEDLSQFLIDQASYYVEGKEKEILIYRKERLLSATEIVKMHSFGERVSQFIINS